MAQIVLASGSPRRRELLERIGVTDFVVRVPEVEESFPEGLTPPEVVAYISREKAEAAARLCGPEDIVITADTMVFLDGLRLGKPQDQVEAFTMLSVLSGRTHHVCTGVTLCRGERMETRAETTAVTFRPLTQDEIWGYIRSGEPMDKAGAYGAQGKAALFVSRIEGDYFNVMGLPLYLLGKMLADFGIQLFSAEEDVY